MDVDNVYAVDETTAEDMVKNQYGGCTVEAGSCP
jgi:hypothetical protein